MTTINKKRGPWRTAGRDERGVSLVVCVTPFGVEVRPLRSRDGGSLVTWERIHLIAAQMDAQAAVTRKVHTVKRGVL